MGQKNSKKKRADQKITYDQDFGDFEIIYKDEVPEVQGVSRTNSLHPGNLPGAPPKYTELSDGEQTQTKEPVFQVTEYTEDSLKERFKQLQAMEKPALESENKIGTVAMASFQPAIAGPTFLVPRISEDTLSSEMANVGPTPEQRQKYSMLMNEIDKRFLCMYTNSEVKDIHQTVTSYLTDVLNNLGWAHPHFKGTLVPTGSFPEGTKLKDPDEFDFMVELDCLKDNCKLVYPSADRPGFAKVLTSCPELSSLQDEEGFLDPIMLSEEFRRRLTEVILVMPRPPKLELGTRFLIYDAKYEGAKVNNLRTHGPSTAIDFMWKGGPVFLTLGINVDVVPAIKFAGLPSGATFPQTDQRHLGEERYSHMTGLRSRGYHVVPNISDTWQVTCAGIETALMQYYSQFDNKLKVYRLCKTMNRAQIEMNGTSQIRYLPTYFLKTLFFYECEAFPDESYWTDDKLHDRVTSILRTFVSCIDRNFMPGYFIQGHNVLEDKNSPMLCMLVADLFSQVFMNGLYHHANGAIQATHRRLQEEMMIKSMMMMAEGDAGGNELRVDAGTRRPQVITVDFSGNKMKFLAVNEKAKDRVL